ncbi:MAG: EamA family transporter [Caldilinea sp.]
MSRVELSYAYPALSLGYVLITLVSAAILGEQVTTLRWAGVFVIVAGVILVTRG